MSKKGIIMDLKYGVLSYTYSHKAFIPLKDELAKNGVYSVNVGDNMQTIAARMLCREIGIQENQITTINRDDLPNYSGEPVILIMNGYFYEPCFPIPAQIIPFFFGFCAPEIVIKKNKSYFKKYEPIGCRDSETTKLFQKYGIDSYTSGCLTFTLAKRVGYPKSPKTFIVYGKGSGDIPKNILNFAPQSISRDAEYIKQRMDFNVFPLNEQDSLQAEQFALNLLNRYKEEATLVITSLLHAACPCVALGIPVILVRKKCDSRFSTLRNLLPVYTPEKFSQINWYPCILDIEQIKIHMKETAKYFINELNRKFYHINALSYLFSENLK